MERAPVRILIVNTYHYPRGGDCLHVFGLAELLRQAGHSIHYFAMQDPRNLPCPDESHFVSNIDYGNEFKRLNPISSARVLSRSIYSREARRKISRMVDEIKPDIAHLHSVRHHITKSILPELSRRRIPVAWTLHDYKEICPNTNLHDGRGPCEACRGRKYFNVVRKRCKRGSLPASIATYLEAKVNDMLDYDRYVGLYVCPSRFLMDRLIENGIDPDKAVNLPNFVSLDGVAPAGHPGKYLLFLGRLERIKGIPTLLRAFAEAARTLSGLELTIAGAGEMEQELKEAIRHRGIAGVATPGFVSGRDLETLIAGARALVLPSECHENYPLSVIEAMARSKPVIASRMGGIPEQVEDGVTGFLFEAGNPRDLADAIKRLYQLPESEVMEMGRRARRRVEEVNSPQRYLSGILQAYGRLAPTKASG